MSIKHFERRKQVIELRRRGLTESQIAKDLGVSERTVRRDLRSLQVQEFVEELKRRQLQDIEESEDPRTRLHYRDKMLDKLMPRQLNTKVEGGSSPILLEIWRPQTEEKKKDAVD